MTYFVDIMSVTWAPFIMLRPCFVWLFWPFQKVITIIHVGQRERKTERKKERKERRRLDVANFYTHKHGSRDEQNGRLSGSGMREKETRLFDYGDNTGRT